LDCNTNEPPNLVQGRQGGLRRELTLRDGLSLVVGTVIGSGIFLVPGPIAQELGPLSSVLLVWGLGGILSLFGALSIAELAAFYPATGGLYVYLREVYGRFIGFLYGWSLFGVIQSGTIATLATGFALYLSQLIPLDYTQQKVVAIVCILLLSTLNCVGLARAKAVQFAAAGSKVLGLAVLVTALFWRGHPNMLLHSMQLRQVLAPSPISWGVALTAVLWAYDGWHYVSFVAGEFHRPQHDLPRALIFGTLACAAAYMVANVAYYAVLAPAVLRTSDHAAATALFAAYGQSATVLISILILVSILGAANGTVMTGPRVYYAMAEDGLFPSSFHRIHPRFFTPVTAIMAQGIWASLLTLTGTFQQLFTYVIFTAWLFYALAVAAVIILRFRMPQIARPFRAPGYPWLQLAFVLAAAAIAIATIISDPLHAFIGIGIVLVGTPFYFAALRLNCSRSTCTGKVRFIRDTDD
jgi:basic amino acid/polyamine antiporter, APA family